jgi:ArsR family transcriptional regulator, cadmium/lead-responsive transcriptional repressor
MSVPDSRQLETKLAAQRLEVTARFFRGLTDLTRLRIVKLLLDEGEMNVSALVARLGQAQSRISSHLACLRWCGYVTSRRRQAHLIPGV